ncbi:MAG: HtaA domain-containing protein [Arthrobacter sp.]|nr:HtaA domain-containing protein [Arthrobacter sp.]
MEMEQLPFDAPVLRWGIKRSFMDYLSRLPDGSVSADAGASIVSGSYFQFEPDGGAPAAEADALAGVRKFRGQVRLSGHHGMMSLVVGDPWLEFGADGVVLSVADTQQAPGSGARLELLRLSRPGRPESPATEWTELPAQLAAAGVDVFNGQYAAGEEMDPVLLGREGPGM